MRALVVVTLLCAACSVDRKVLDTKVFQCERDEDCVAGYGCLDLRPYGRPFCAPEYTDACQGSRTAGGLCVESCDLAADDCREDFSCVRGFLPSSTITALVDRLDTGWCLPVTACDSTDDCPAGNDICMSEYVQSTPDNPVASDSLICMPRCDTNADCDEGRGEVCSEGFDDGGGAHVCLPKCDSEDVCPPLFNCFDLPQAAGGEGVCIPGVYPFLPCQDGLGCLVAECIDAGAAGQKFCTYESCDPEGPLFCLAFPVYFDGGLGVQCVDDTCIGVVPPYAPCTDTIPCGGDNSCVDLGEFSMCTQQCPRFGSCPEGGYCEVDIDLCLPNPA